MNFIQNHLKRIMPQTKTNVYYIDNIWSLDKLDSKDYGLKNNRGFRFVLVIIDNFRKFGWTVSVKIENAQSINSFENILISSKRKWI